MKVIFFIYPWLGWRLSASRHCIKMNNDYGGTVFWNMIQGIEHSIKVVKLSMFGDMEVAPRSFWYKISICKLRQQINNKWNSKIWCSVMATGYEKSRVCFYYNTFTWPYFCSSRGWLKKVQPLWPHMNWTHMTVICCCICGWPYG